MECYGLTANIWEIYFEVDLTDPYIQYSLLLLLRFRLDKTKVDLTINHSAKANMNNKSQLTWFSCVSR